MDTQRISTLARGSATAIEEHADRLEKLQATVNKEFREALASEMGQYQRALKHEGVDELALPMLLGEYSRYLLR